MPQLDERKRESLKDFIKEQMEGPNALEGRFYYTNNNGERIELLNTTPGSIYSTAILFPKKERQLENQEETNHENLGVVDDLTDEEGNDSNAEDFDESDKSDDSDDKLCIFNQRFPNTIGLSCCLEPIENLNNHVSIEISGRYYTKLSRNNYPNIVVKVDDIEGLRLFLNEHHDVAEFIVLREDGISLNIGNVEDRSYRDLNNILKNVDTSICRTIAQNNQEFLRIDNPEGLYLQNYKKRIYYRIKNDTDLEPNDIEERIASGKAIINEIEKYETYLSDIRDAISLCNARAYGYWEPHKFNYSIKLADFNLNIENKEVYAPSRHPSLRNIIFNDNNLTLEIDTWLQLINYDGRIYMKVQIENASTPFQETAGIFFSPVTTKVNERSFFGISIKIESDRLCTYHDIINQDNQNEEVQRLNYLYREIEDYGVGHYCSVAWDRQRPARWIKTEFIPTCEVPDVEPTPKNGDVYEEDEDGLSVPQRVFGPNDHFLEFKWLSLFSNTEDFDILTGLRSFVNKYGEWINRQRAKIDNEDNIGNSNLDACERDHDRMLANIGILENDPEKLFSFRMMNSAMFIQLYHGRNKCPASNFDFYRNANDCLYNNAEHASWRAFQLAFILLNLDGIFHREDDQNWNNRNSLVDLVWFPTGGGKTEAYLGIIALCIIDRRRSHPENGGGTSVIMRYTLRLLSIQQFQRALRLILALELMRTWGIEGYNLGEEEISIGLYVGKDSLPNEINGENGLTRELEKWRNGEESKIPISVCPFCGENLDATPVRGNIIFRCNNRECEFSRGIPVRLCDELIYRYPPTLLFGTVDKFAAIAWRVDSDRNKDSRRLFGFEYDNNAQEPRRRNLPPSLIIQDELHLINGPLGSAVGFFERAIDQLCTTEEGYRPKIISSTATTRNTEQQIRALYDRDLNIFPKPGISYDDSFFSFYRRHKDTNGNVVFDSKREYMGILPTGRTQMAVQMRLAATLFVHRAITEKKYSQQLNFPEVESMMNNYHSIINYFNSLKDVGRTDAQFNSEYHKYTNRLFKRVLKYSDALQCNYCYSMKKSELTGRLSGNAINRSLNEVSSVWRADDRYIHLDGNEIRPGTTPPDFILATNMISVGIDVDRFNTMIVYSMPRNIAEYIQATSRVARKVPGLVITLHNPFSSRDISHFEKFIEFHEKLYYYVEPISITPFSNKCIKKYMPTFIATIVRHKYSNLSNNNDANNITEDLSNEIREAIIGYFQDRLEPDERTYILNAVDTAFSIWLHAKEEAGNNMLLYSYNSRNRNQERPHLFLSMNETDGTEGIDTNIGSHWHVEASLRSVEKEAHIHPEDSNNRNNR